MLNQETKKRIDSARDILVGKVPDPKAQVEQITTAMIYKFMDDMDKEAQELGGKASFFTNGYQKYSWTTIIDPKLGGHERLNLYAEAVIKMSENPHIPQLFRDIFKDAFLPYRSPETLSMFLKEINGFKYLHSEDLGDAFEYLLSVLGSQGDAGQFRTPRHIIDFIVDVVDPKKDESILDPACGTAGFLISAFKHIQKQHKDKPLNPEDKKRMMNHIVGYDISPDMVKLSKVNMYLHGFPTPHIYEYDTLSSEDKWEETYDVIMANPPFMTPKGGIRPHKRFSVQANRAEVLFVNYIMEHLNANGRAGVIVPEGVIFQSGNAYRQLRKMLIDDKYLYAVVSLPAGVFQPYSGVKTSILLIDKTIAKKVNHILFTRISADGFDLGAQRRSTIYNDLPLALDAIFRYQNHAISNGTYSIGGWPEGKYSIDTHPNCQFVSKKEIADGGDYNLSGERYRKIDVDINQKWPMVELQELCEINPKKSQKNKLPPDTEVSFVPMADLSENQMSFKAKQTKILSDVSGSYTYFINNDVLLAKVTPCFENGKAGLAQNLKNGIGFGSSEFIILRSLGKILPELIYHFVFYRHFRELGKSQMTGTGGLQRIPIDFVKRYRIPLPPLEVQKEIVEEIKKYQNIIDGAKQIIYNYKPSIKVDSSWNIIELGNLFLDTKIGLVKDKSMQADVFPHPYIKMENISLDGNLELDSVVHVEASKEELAKYTLNDGDFIYNTRNAPNLVGKSTVFHGENDKYLFNNNILRIRFRKEADSDYINYYLNTEEGKQKIKALVSGTTSVAAIYQKNFATISVPLPPIEIQKKIVNEISREKMCVFESKKIIDIFEKKITRLISDIL